MTSLAISNKEQEGNGFFLVVGTGNAEILIWDITKGSTLRREPCSAILRGHTETVNTLTFSGGVGGAVLASGSADGVIHRVVTFDPADRTLASGGQDTMVRTWNVATGSLLNTFRGHDSPINNVSFSPSGS